MSYLFQQVTDGSWHPATDVKALIVRFWKASAILENDGANFQCIEALRIETP